MSQTIGLLVGIAVVILFNVFYYLGKWLGYREGVLAEKKRNTKFK